MQKNQIFLLKNVGLNPTRSGLIKVLQSMGGEIEIINQSIVCNEEVGDVSVNPLNLKELI